MRGRCRRRISAKVLPPRSALRETTLSFRPTGSKTREAVARRGSSAAPGLEAVPFQRHRSRRQWRCDSFCPSTPRILLPLSNEEKRATHHPHFGPGAGTRLETRPEKVGAVSCVDFSFWSGIKGRQHEDTDRKI